jgi:hypothetical protein
MLFAFITASRRKKHTPFLLQNLLQLRDLLTVVPIIKVKSNNKNFNNFLLFIRETT